MKKKLLAFLLMLTVVASLGTAQGKWRLNPYTGKLDYYEPKAGLAPLASPIFTGDITVLGRIIIGDYPSRNVAVGAEVLGYVTTATKNTGVGYQALWGLQTGIENIGVGYSALAGLVSGNKNAAVGRGAMLSKTSGDYNSAFGASALQNNISGNNNVALGNKAGYYETGSDKLFIDNEQRASEADGQDKALIYGVFDALTANQKLYFNSNVHVKEQFGLSSAGRNLKTWWNFEDFVGSSYSDTSFPRGIWMAASAGAGARAADGVGTASRPGIARLATGTTNSGSAAFITGYNSLQHFLFGGGVYTIEADIYITDLSTATETYALRFGFGDSNSGDEVDGAYFEYYDVGGGTPTPNWYRCTASNSTRTKTDTTIAAVAGAWTRLKVVVNSAGTSVEYFINGTSVGSNTTNIPTGTNRETSAVYSVVKSAGTTARLFNIDWAWIHVDLATSR